MTEKLKSLRAQVLLPVLVIVLFIVILFTSIFSSTVSNMIMRQEQAVNAAGFNTVSGTIPPYIATAIESMHDVTADQQVISCIRSGFSSPAEMIHAKVDCLNYIREKTTHADWANGLFIMRPDGSMFGVLPDGNYFLDDPDDNPLPAEMKERILRIPLGQTLWAGSVSGEEIYGFHDNNTPNGFMIAAWRAVDVRFGECCVLMLIDHDAFDRLFSALEDENSTWRIFAADYRELYHTGAEACKDPEQLISEGSSEKIFIDESGRSLTAYSMAMSSPEWMLVREVSMEESHKIIRMVRLTVIILAGLIFLIALAIYGFWLRKFTQQYRKLLSGITRMGQERAPLSGTSFFTTEFGFMQQEIDRTSIALHDQMDMIRKMEREQAELENQKKEQEMIQRELGTAKQIQESMLPHTFPPFPDRKEIDLYASMDPARDVGGDFYDFFFLDEDHLCLIIADVSGKGIPGAMFMILSKRIIEDNARKSSHPSEIIRRTNETLCDNNQAEMFVTVWLGILEISTGILTATNAGHEYPIIQKAGGRFELFKDPHDLFVGFIEDVQYKEYELQLSPGDRVFVYTDGVPEATAANKEMFGLDRTVAALNITADATPEALLQNIKTEVDAFVGDAEQFDDLTMLCVQYNGSI